MKSDLGIKGDYADIIQYGGTLSELEHTLHSLDEWSAKRPVDINILLGPGSAHIKPEPLGTCLVISAWNYPIFLAIPYVATAIAAGNCCILKPSNRAPAVSNVCAKLFDLALDKRFYRCIEGRGAVGFEIVKEGVEVIVFTGGTRVAKLVASEAGKHLTRCIFELGGKNPCVVDKDAQLWPTAEKIVFAKFTNAG